MSNIRSEEEFEIMSGSSAVTTEGIDELFTDAFITSQVMTPETKKKISQAVGRHLDPLTDELSSLATRIAFMAYRRATNSQVSLEEFSEKFEETDAQMELLASYISRQGLETIERYWFSPFLDN